MSATRQPLWPTPDDGVQTESSDAQLDVERTIVQLLLPFHTRPDTLAHEHPPEQPLSNPWLDLPPPPAASSAPDDTSAETAKGKGKGKNKAHASPVLNRQAHIAFLARMLEPLPGPYVAFDSSRSWVLYWVTHSYDLLRTALDPHGRARAISTLLSFQNPAGGFGGGPNQIAHLMSTYPAICALAIVGGPGPAPSPADVKAGRSVEIGKGGWDAIDRQGMYRWITSLKQSDGSFVVHAGGEVDVRASYCVSCIATLLGICTPELVAGMRDFIVSCQTYEGGLAASSQPSSQDSAALPWGLQPQLGEAHGGYAHCALASYLSLITLDETYQEVSESSARPASSSAGSSRVFDLDGLLRWACSQQGLAIELGAMRGRTNKLVDGCYGWFGGAGLFAVLDACLVAERGRRRRTLNVDLDSATNGTARAGTEEPALNGKPLPPQHAEDGWSTDSNEESQASPYSTVEDDWLFDATSLQEYILIAAQTINDASAAGASAGGLRDKPGKKADAYHTCYNLSGLSLCQHRIVRSKEAQVLLEQRWKIGSSASHAASGGDETLTAPDLDGSIQIARHQTSAWQKACYVSALAWLAEPAPAAGHSASPRIVGDPKTNTTTPTHPIFNLTFPRVKGIMDWAYNQR